MVSYCLEAYGLTARVASNVAEAVAVLRAGAVDCIVTDIALPAEDGFALLAQVQASPATRAIPVIAVTSFDGPIRQRALDAGFAMFITKPVNLTAFPIAIASVVAASRSRELPEDAQCP